MIQFNFHRFKKLARWSLTNDKRYYVKATLQILVVMLLVFLFFTLLTRTNGGRMGNYGPCAFAVMFMIIGTIIVGPAYMFYSLEGKHDRQALTMLPASNFEKYIMRYATWMIMLPLWTMAFLVADVLQYFIHGLLGHDYQTFVLSVIIKFFNDTSRTSISTSDSYMLVSITISFLWFHSMYALGANFFRTRKFNWVLTTLIIILFIVLTALLTREDSTINQISQLNWRVSKTIFMISCVIYSGWTLLNFWLSYRLFCRNQVIGKLVNI
jgi:hypothetical protein